MTLYRRGSGYWGWDARDRRLPGGRIAVSLRTKDRKEAKRRAHALALLLERGEVAVLERLRKGDVHISEIANAVRDESISELRAAAEVDLSLGAMVDRVMQTKEATRSAGTQAKYQQMTGAMLAEWGRGASILDIGVDRCRAWLYGPKGERRKVWAPNTQASAHMVASYLWRTAIELEMEAAERVGIKPRLTRNPWDRVEVADPGKTRHSFLEPREWADVLGKVENTPSAALLALLCLGGLRIQEALNLRTGIDVVLDGPDPVVRVQSREGEFAWRVKHPNSQREVPAFPALHAVLAAHAESGFAGARFFVRAPRWDRPLGYTTARGWVKEAFERAGLRYGREGDALTAHSLRHTFASWLIREGWSSTLVAKLMGNTAKEVDETYAHLAPDDLRRVVATIDRMVGQ